MDRKFFKILTILLVVLSPLFVIPAAAVEGYGKFPFNGGTTTDGIEISKPTLFGFFRYKQENCYMATKVDKKNHSYIKFNIKVPEGKEAGFNFNRFLYEINTDGSQRRGAKMTLVVECDGQPIFRNSWNEKISARGVDVIIPEGEHVMKLNFTTSHRRYNFAGSINDLSLHVHEYGDTTVLRVPLCGQPGQKIIECSLCQKQKSFEIIPEYDKHTLKKIVIEKFSCMSTPSTITLCEHCPYVTIEQDSTMTSHDFDANGTCKVCHLSMPKCNADSTVFEVHNASEMRVLSELVSIGKISGNIGIDIKGDLVFGTDITLLPLGNSNNPFRGVINGNGHHVRGIFNTYQGTDCMGFVGVARGSIQSHAVIANLIFDQDNVLQGMASVGGIVGDAAYCDIINCASFGTFIGLDKVGGIVGYAGQHVNIVNCASAVSVSTPGFWNGMGCGMQRGRIMNSYDMATNKQRGMYDELPNTTWRHCFSTLDSGSGLRQVTQNLLSSYEMVELLNQESESTCFVKSQDNPYPIPVVNADIQAQSNPAFATPRAEIPRRAASLVADNDDETSEKDSETIVMNGYTDSNAASKFGFTIDEIMHNDSADYAGFDLSYIVTRTAPAGVNLYDRLANGELSAFESYIIPVDSSFIRLREYKVVSADRVIHYKETVADLAGANMQIDEYQVKESTYYHKSRITFLNDNDFIYQENINDILQPTWGIETEIDDEGKPLVTNAYSYNYLTGEIHLEGSFEYGPDGELKDEVCEEYFDAETNTNHFVYILTDPDTGEILSREHYILRAEDNFPIEVRSEDMSGGTPSVTEGLYFIYDDEGKLLQAVYYTVDKETGNLRPFIYYDFLGNWEMTPFTTTAIQVPTVKHPSVKEYVDPNIYDMHGRIVRRVTNHQDPFAGLPRGLYLYQGSKYLKRK